MFQLFFGFGYNTRHLENPLTKIPLYHQGLAQCYSRPPCNSSQKKGIRIEMLLKTTACYGPAYGKLIYLLRVLSSYRFELQSDRRSILVQRRHAGFLAGFIGRILARGALAVGGLGMISKLKTYFHSYYDFRFLNFFLLKFNIYLKFYNLKR